jgi:integrase
MEILKLIQRNRLPRKQSGERIETKTSWALRYYDGGVQKYITLAPKNDMYRSWADVEPLIKRHLEQVNAQAAAVSGTITLADFIELHYLPWCELNRAANTFTGYQKLWRNYLKPHVGTIRLTMLETSQVTQILTHHAEEEKGSRTLSHIKWFLSAVYQHAIARGIVPKNPVDGAKWLRQVKRPAKQAVYSLPDVLAMLRVLEPVDRRAAAAVALTFFASLRPSEARELQWSDWNGAELRVRGTKTAASDRVVGVIEPLRSLLGRLQQESVGPYILSSNSGKPLSMDSLNYRLIAPTLKAAGIEWRGYYPGRRGFSSLMTNLTKTRRGSDPRSDDSCFPV